MKLNRIISFAVIGIALFALLLQGAGSPAAAHNTLASVSAQVAPQANTGKGKPASPADQAPYHLTAQGRLTDPSGNPITTARNLTFKLYTALSGGTLLFTEGPVSVTPDSNGLFTYQLGSATPINIGLLQSMANKVYLGITVGSDAEMAPRLELTLAPYAASLAPGAYVSAALPQLQNPNGYGVVNTVNSDTTDPLNAGLYGNGVLGVYGISNHGYGLLGESSGNQAQRGSAGVGGSSSAANGAGGVFTDTAASGSGVVAAGALQGLVASANSNSGNTSAGLFNNYSPASNANNVAVRANASSGYGVYAASNANSTALQSSGVVGVSTVASGVGGVFTDTANFGAGVRGYGSIGVDGEASSSGTTGGVAGVFNNNGGGSGTQYGIAGYNNSTGGGAGFGGYFQNYGGGNNYQYGIQAFSSSAGGTTGYGGSFTNTGGGSGPQYGVSATSTGFGLYGTSTTSTNQQDSAGVAGIGIVAGGVFTATTSSTNYGGYGVVAHGGDSSASGFAGGGIGIFSAGGSDSLSTGGDGVDSLAGNGSQQGGDAIVGYGGSATSTSSAGSGIVGFGGQGQSGNIGFDGQFGSPFNGTNYTSVYAQGHVSAFAYDTHASYDLVVEYHGTQPLHPGDVLALDGNNHVVHGEATLGVVQANAQNATLAMGVAQYRMAWQEHKQILSNGKTRDDGGWHIDDKATTIQPGDTLSVVVLGQAQMKVSTAAKMGDRLTLASDGGLSVAAKGDDNIIGKVASAPDKDGYVTVLVNLK